MRNRQTSPTAETEAALLTAVLTRDPAAWRQLVDRYEPQLRRTLRDYDDESWSENDVDDLLGDFWLVLLEDDLRRLRGFQASGGGDLGGWLALVAVEVARRERRRRARVPEHVPYDATVEKRIAAAVVCELGERGILRPLDTGNLVAVGKKASCRDARVRSEESLDHTTTERVFESSSLNRKVDELFETLRARRKRKRSSAA